MTLCAACCCANNVTVTVTMEHDEVKSCRHGYVHGKDRVLVSGKFDTSNVDKAVQDDLGFELVAVGEESPREGQNSPSSCSSKFLVSCSM